GQFNGFLLEQRVSHSGQLGESHVENRLILFPGGKPGAGVVALDAASGREIWRALDEGAANSSPIIIQAGGVRQLIVWTLQSVTSLEPLTGKPFWRERYACGSSDVV